MMIICLPRKLSFKIQVPPPRHALNWTCDIGEKYDTIIFATAQKRLTFLLFMMDVMKIK